MSPTFNSRFTFIVFSLCLMAAVFGCKREKPSCSDGIYNQGERKADCGGPCEPCPTCIDGIMNQGEAGIDCGGMECAPCASCSDGIRNQNETDIDCGGPCASCPIVYPPAGRWGSNIIRNDTVIVIPTDEPGTQSSYYAMRADLPEATSLKVIMKNTTVGSNDMWFYYPNDVIGWGVDTYDYTNRV